MGHLIRLTFIFLLRLLARLDIQGVENIPQGGVVLATNHLSILDPPVLLALLNRGKLTALIADKYEHAPVISWVVNNAGGIWLHREDMDMQALRAAKQKLEDGWLLGIAPEGTRSTTGELLPAKTGVAFLAEKGNVPILPVGIWGTEDAIKRWKRLRRADIHVRFGEPFQLPPLDKGNRTECLERNTQEIMCRIASMLPPKYRGAYQDCGERSM